MTSSEFRKKYGAGKIKNKDSELKGKIKLADRWFSRAVRLMAANGERRTKCVSCGKVQDVKEMDCGHFFTRNHKSVRWEHDNARAQCAVREYGCNTKMNRPEVQNAFREALIKSGVDLLKLEMKKNNLWKPTAWELDMIIEENKTIVKALLREKGITKWW